MNRLKSVLEQRSKDWDPRVRRRLFSWRMFLIILLVVSVLSIGNVLMLEKLLKMPWGKKAVKVAIAIGKDAERSVLEAFTGNPEAVLDAGNPEVLTHFIKWASTVASAVSNPTSNPMEVGDVQETEQSSQETQEPRMLDGNITLPDLDDVNAEDVW